MTTGGAAAAVGVKCGTNNMLQTANAMHQPNPFHASTNKRKNPFARQSTTTEEATNPFDLLKSPTNKAKMRSPATGTRQARTFGSDITASTINQTTLDQHHDGQQPRKRKVSPTTEPFPPPPAQRRGSLPGQVQGLDATFSNATLVISPKQQSRKLLRALSASSSTVRISSDKTTEAAWHDWHQKGIGSAKFESSLLNLIHDLPLVSPGSWAI